MLRRNRLLLFAFVAVAGAVVSYTKLLPSAPASESRVPPPDPENNVDLVTDTVNTPARWQIARMKSLQNVGDWGRPIVRLVKGPANATHIDPDFNDHYDVQFRNALGDLATTLDVASFPTPPSSSWASMHVASVTSPSNSMLISPTALTTLMNSIWPASGSYSIPFRQYFQPVIGTVNPSADRVWQLNSPLWTALASPYNSIWSNMRASQQNIIAAGRSAPNAQNEWFSAYRMLEYAVRNQVYEQAPNSNHASSFLNNKVSWDTTNGPTWARWLIQNNGLTLKVQWFVFHPIQTIDPSDWDNEQAAQPPVNSLPPAPVNQSPYPTIEFTTEFAFEVVASRPMLPDGNVVIPAQIGRGMQIEIDGGLSPLTLTYQDAAGNVFTTTGEATAVGKATFRVNASAVPGPATIISVSNAVAVTTSVDQVMPTLLLSN